MTALYNNLQFCQYITSILIHIYEFLAVSNHESQQYIHIRTCNCAMYFDLRLLMCMYVTLRSITIVVLLSSIRYLTYISCILIN